jgi:DNA primase
LEALEEVGLIAPRLQGRGYYDRFRDRVMFPIRDVQGRPVAFGGRIMPESPLLPRAPKYYNSTETPLFSKSDVLYGLDLARHAGATVGYLAVVEGYTDVMMAHQCGVAQVVATMGTALNARHVAQLRRYAKKVVLVYDADAGGMTGVDRALELFVSQDVELAVATLPDGLDPCDLLVRPGGTETFQQVLGSAVDALDFVFVRLLGYEGTQTVEASRAILDRILRVMVRSGSWQNKGEYPTSLRVKQELIITRLASRLSLKLETVWGRLAELKTEFRRKEEEAARPLVQASAARATRPVEPTSTRVSAAVRAQLNLVELLLAHPGFVVRAVGTVSPAEFTHPDARRVLEELYAAHAAGLVPDMEVLRERLADRPDLFESAERRQFIGQQMQEPEEKLAQILGWFTNQKVEAEERALIAMLTGGDIPPEKIAEISEKLKALRRRRSAG